MICSNIQQCYDFELGNGKGTECVNGRKNCIKSSDSRTNVNHALKQIHGTMKRFREHFENFEHVFGRVVAVSAVPRIQATPAYVKLNEQLIQLGGNLVVKSINYSESDSNLLQDEKE